VDYKFWLPLVVTVIGVGFQAYQIRLMKQKIEEIPSPRSPKRVAAERALVRRLYTPVFLMVGLILVCWLPFIIAAVRPSPLPVFIAAWGGTTEGCSAAIDTSSFVKVADKYNMFITCHVFDPTVDEMADDKIAVSKPFQITGGLVSIVIAYDPNATIRSVAKIGAQTGVSVLLLPKDRDGTSIRRLSDVSKEGGQILLQGGKLKD
jgi:hypothetical protein